MPVELAPRIEAFQRVSQVLAGCASLDNVAGCCFASLSQGVTTLRHSQSPGYIGCLLPGGLTLTRTGLAPASRRLP